MFLEDESESDNQWRDFTLHALQACRLMRVTYGLFYFPVAREFFAVVLKCIQALSTVGYAYFIILYMFGMLILFAFGGTVRKDLDWDAIGASEWYYMNHSNDLLGSMITLYVSMIGNNWFVVRDTFVYKSGHGAKWFFNIWYVLCDAIFMNILIGFVVGIYEEVNGNINKSNREIVAGMKANLPQLLDDAKKFKAELTKWEEKFGDKGKKTEREKKKSAKVAPAKLKVEELDF